MIAKNIPLADISIDGDTQVRVKIDNQTVADYAQAIEEGERLPPITLVYDGSTYWLADGFHRYHATKRTGCIDIQAKVSNGTLDDAKWHACGANKTNGLRMTADDKRRAIEIALSTKPDASSRSIATHIGCSHNTVESMRSEPTGQLTSSSETRQGADGKKRKAPQKAVQPTVTPSDDGDAMPSLGGEKTAQTILDRMGELEMLRDALKQIKKEVAAAVHDKDALFAHLNEQAFDVQLGNCIAMLGEAIPHVACPDCKGKGCRDCRHTGYITKHQLKTRGESA